MDQKVNIEIMRTSYEITKAANFEVEYHEYFMGHSICREQMQHIVEFVKKIVPL